MKNEEFLADAIGGLDEELLFSVNRKREMDDTNMNRKVFLSSSDASTRKRFHLPISHAVFSYEYFPQ